MSELQLTEGMVEEDEPWSIRLGESICLRKAHWVPLLLLLSHAMFNLICSALLALGKNEMGSLHYLFIFFLGAHCSQIIICALWAAMSVDALKQRVPFAIMAFALLSILMLQVFEGGFEAFCIASALFISIWGLASTIRYQQKVVISPVTKIFESRRPSRQFSIRYLLGWTAVISILLAAAKFFEINILKEDNPGSTRTSLVEFLLSIIGIYFLMLAPAMLCFMLLLVFKLRRIAFLVAISFTYLSCVVSSAMILEATSSTIHALMSESFLPVFVLISSSVIGMIASAFALRWAGYRIVRQTDKAIATEPLLAS